MVRKSGLAACLIGVLVLVAAACTPAPATAPVAKLQANLTSGEAPFSVSFTSTGSTVPEGTTWLWEFGAGEGSSTDVGSTSHVYSNIGSFTAKLTLTAPGGTSTSESVTITVNEPPPDTTFFVRAVDGVDNTNCGPKTAPCQTIDHGQSRAAATPGITRVRVAGGSYGAFTVRSGLTLEGGWNQTFTARGPADISTVSGAYDGSTNWAIRANNITAPTTVFGFTVQGATAGAGQTTAGVLVNGAVNGLLLDSLVVNGGVGVDATGLLVDGAGVSATIKNSDVNSGTPVGAGNSAYGVRALNGSVLSVQTSTVTAQAGIAGTDSAVPAPTKSSDGCNGNQGQAGRTGSTLEGGRRVGGSSCGGAGVAMSGKGGDGGTWTFGCAGFCISRDNGLAGDNGGGGAPGGDGGESNCCGAGNGGAGTGGLAGIAGSAGAGGANSSASTGPVWIGRAGGAGGTGGGGGGGGSASTVAAGGGSGGGGGIGGAPATSAGTAGGGSFAVYAYDSTVTVTGSTLTAGNGARGGNGSPGGAAGNGGSGGATNDGPTAQTGTSGAGGGGGAGAGGGGAGGGAGGPSVAAYNTGTGSIDTDGGGNVLKRANNAAIGGNGGNGGNGGAGGAGPAGNNGTSGPAGIKGGNGAVGLALAKWDNGTLTP